MSGFLPVGLKRRPWLAIAALAMLPLGACTDNLSLAGPELYRAPPPDAAWLFDQALQNPQLTGPACDGWIAAHDMFAAYQLIRMSMVEPKALPGAKEDNARGEIATAYRSMASAESFSRKWGLATTNNPFAPALLTTGTETDSQTLAFIAGEQAGRHFIQQWQAAHPVTPGFENAQALYSVFEAISAAPVTEQCQIFQSGHYSIRQPSSPAY